MNFNAYEPPKSDIAIEDNQPGSIVKALVAGTVIEVTGSILVSLAVGLVYGFFLASQGNSAEEIQQAMEQMEPWSIYGISAIFLGLLVSSIAGYGCAYITNTNSYQAAYLLSGISFTLSIIFGLGAYSWWVLVLLGFISASAVVLGAHIYIRKLGANKN